MEMNKVTYDETIQEFADKFNNLVDYLVANGLAGSDFASKFKSDVESNLLGLKTGEPALTTDTNKVLIGSTIGNIELAKQERIDQISVNALQYGIKGDGSDESIAIQNLLDSHDNVYFPKPPMYYGIGKTIDIGIGSTRHKRKTASFATNALFRPLKDVDVVRVLGYGVTVKGLVVDVNELGVSFTSAGLVLYADNENNPCVENTIEYTFIQNNNIKTGTGIKCIASGSGYIYYNKITGHIRSGRYGVLIDNSSPDGINSNTFDLDINSPLQLVKIHGGSGNVFRGRGQATWIPTNLPPGLTQSQIEEMACIELSECEHNQIDMFVYDVGRPGIMKYSYEFKGYCRANTYLTGGSAIKGKYHYSNEMIGRYQSNDQQKHRITNRFAGARQKQTQGFGYSSTPSDFRHGLDDYLMISPETNSLADLRNIQSITVTPQNCSFTAGVEDPKSLFNHNSRGYMRYTPTDVTAPSSLTIDIALKTSETIYATGLIKEFIRSQKVRVQAFVSADGNIYEEMPAAFDAQIYEDNATEFIGYQGKNKYDYGTDVLFLVNSGYDDHYDVTHIRFVLSLPALYETSTAVKNGEHYELYYLWVNCASRKSTRGNNAYPYIGGDKFSGDISFSNGAGIVLEDEWGAKYRLIVNTDGTLGVESLGY